MSQVRHFQQAALQFQSYGGQDIERAAICRLIGPADSQTMGAGLARFDGVSIEWTVLYDELIVVLDGGKISAMGTHDELLKTSTIYQEVFYSQQKGGLQ